MSRSTSRSAATALSAAAVLLLLAGCATSAEPTGDADAVSTDPVSGGTLEFVHDTDPGCLDPQQAANWAQDLARNVADSLLDEDPDTHEYVPWLASEWSPNEDGTEFTFTIRDGVTFSDGSELTAEVVKANFDSIKNDLGAKASYVVGVFSTYVESVVDGDDVTVRFSEPNFPFVQAASSPSLGILSAETLEKTPEERCQGDVVGTGPFVLDHYAKASEVLLTKRSGYDWASPNAAHEGEAYLDEVHVQIVTEASVRDGLLSSDQVDGIRNPTETQQEIFDEAPYFSAIRPNPGIASAIDWNYNRELISDRNVRLAVLKGIDREELEDTVLGPFGLAATSVLTSSTFGFSENSELLAYEPDEAERLLEESGWEVGDDGIREKDGERLTIRGVVFDYQKAIVELEAQQLAEIGIELDLTLASNASIGTEWKTGEYDFFQHAITAADPDVLRGWFLTELSDPTTRHFTETTTDLDDLLLEQPTLENGSEREEVLAEIQRIVLENAYSVPINQSVNVFAFADRVQGFTLDAQSSSRFFDVWKSE